LKKEGELTREGLRRGKGGRGDRRQDEGKKAGGEGGLTIVKKE